MSLVPTMYQKRIDTVWVLFAQYRTDYTDGWKQSLANGFYTSKKAAEKELSLFLDAYKDEPGCRICYSFECLDTHWKVIGS